MSESTLRSEGRALYEYWQLQLDPIFRGRGVLRGRGNPVLVLPGLFGNDFYLRPLRDWLSRIGYRPVTSTLPLNAGCPHRLQQQVMTHVERQLDRYQGRLTIIGHSRGGLLGKAIATRMADRCTGLIALGSPLGGALRAGREQLAGLMQRDSSHLASKPVADAGRAAMRLFSPDCRFPSCECAYVQDLLAPLPSSVRVTAIFSAEDPVVRPEASRIDGAENITVSGSHSGLVVNRHVYRHMARALDTGC